jgi:hypothetical protein
MWRMRSFGRSASDRPSPESTVHGAGMALACAYSCAAEFEAAVIRAKRDDGVYGPKRLRRQVLRVALPIFGMALVVLTAIALG